MLTTIDRKKCLFFHFPRGIILLLLLFGLTLPTIGQDMNKKSGLIRGNPYSDDKNNNRKFGSFGGSDAGGGSTRWGFGLKGGINMTSATANESYAVFSYTAEPANTITDKQYYPSSDNKGFQVTFLAKYALFNGLSIGIMPTFSSYTYGYETNYSWLDFDNATNSLFLTYNHKQDLNYIEVPLIVRYDLAISSIKPFVHGGGYYGHLLSALKTVDVSGQDFASGGTEEFNGATSTIGINDQFQSSQFGIIVGGGIGYVMGPASIELGVDYKIGMNKIINGNTRYNDTALISGSYDVLDDVNLKHLSFTFGIIFGI
jgi:hypothetical protein